MIDEKKKHGSDNDHLKHSGFGVASFIISLVIGIIDFVIIGIVSLLRTTPEGFNPSSARGMLLAWIFLAGFLVSLVGIALAVAGLVQKNQKKTFSVLGFIFNELIILGVMGLLFITVLIGR